MDSAWGWYGKLPALGDFASRRLPQAFIEPWDAWLAAGLARWRDNNPHWLEAYLAGPIWCFHLGRQALGPGHAGTAWAGVLMPSVDRVGRYFPLTVAAPAPSDTSLPRLLHRLRHTAQVAAQAMHEDWSAQAFDQALAALDELTVPPWIDADADGAAATLQQALHEPAAAQGSLWWPADAPAAPLQHHHRLPAGAAFERLLAGAPLTS